MNGDAQPLLLPGDPAVPVQVRHSDRARRVRIQVRASGVVLVVPRRASLGPAWAFLLRQRDWIHAQLRRVAAASAETRVPVNALRLLDEALTVHLTASVSRSRAGISRLGSELHLRVPEAGAVPARRTLEAWLREQARLHFGERTRHWAARMGVTHERVRIAAQRTRWGSCSATGTVSYNWRAVMVPFATAEYLVVHELAHLREMNHSRRFWSVVRDHLPDFEAARADLKGRGNLLGGDWIRLVPAAD